MRSGLLLLVFALALGAALPSLAATWITIGSNAAGDHFDLDQDSLRYRGATLDVRVRAKMHTPTQDNLSGKTYVTAITERLESCGDRQSATIGYIYYDASGAPISTYNVPETGWLFTALTPGSLGEQFQEDICAAADRHGLTGEGAPGTPGHLIPVLKVGPKVTTGWISIGNFDQRSNHAYILQSHIYLIDHDIVMFVMKKVMGSPTPAPGAPPVSESYTQEFMDCAAATMADGSMDLYSADGTLLKAIPLDPDKLKVKPIALATVADSARDVVCRPGVAKRLAPGDKGDGNDEDDGGVYFGTGWMAPKGYLITANHVIEGMKSLKLMQNGKEVGTAVVVLADPANDIAVLKPTFTDGARLAMGLNLEPVVLGESVFTLGYPVPHLMGVALKMTSGEVSALSGLDAHTGRIDDARMIQISAPVQPGNSGGPVMTNDGRVMGIVISRMQNLGEEGPAENVNYALRIGYVQALLAGLPDIGGYRPPKLEPNRAAAIADLQSGVFMIVGSKQSAPPVAAR